MKIRRTALVTTASCAGCFALAVAGLPPAFGGEEVLMGSASTSNAQVRGDGLDVFRRKERSGDRLRRSERRLLGVSAHATVRRIAARGAQRFYAVQDGHRLCVARVSDANVGGDGGVAATCGSPSEVLVPQAAIISRGVLFGLAPNGVTCVRLSRRGHGSFLVPVRNNGFVVGVAKAPPTPVEFVTMRRCG